MIHYIRIKKTKKNRKSFKDWNLGMKYPVLSIDVERMGSTTPKIDPEDIMADALKDGGFNPHDNFDEFDDDDQEEIDMLVAKLKSKQTKSENVRTWLLIGNAKTGTYRWVTTEEVKFSSLSFD